MLVSITSCIIMLRCEARTEKHKKCLDRLILICSFTRRLELHRKSEQKHTSSGQVTVKKVSERVPAPLHSYVVLIKLPFRRCDGSEHKKVGRLSSDGFGATYRLLRGTDCLVFKKQNIFHLMNFRQQQERENTTFLQ